ncbi:MAG: fumarylacetoacetate hydrolase family protein [Spirochaetes bacterium]|nr:fumarylacetoacetate hydrolase family protein [Spirochaetota bacterium]
MKIVCFYPAKETGYSGKPSHLGVKMASGIVDLTAAGYKANLAETITNWASNKGEIASLASNGTLPLVDESAICYTTPAPFGAKIVCVGQNYKEHIKEMAKGGPIPEIKEPVLFAKFSDTLSAHGGTVRLPSDGGQYDYEAELVIVIGTGGMNIPEEKALSHIFGYTCGNDISDRDAQFRSTQWMIGKNRPGFAALGPWLVTADELEPGNLAIKTYRGNEVVQDSRTSDLLFNVTAIVSYASRFIQLNPGDLIYTGTPSGVIGGKDPDKRIWLKPGESVEVEIEGVGRLCTNFVE